MNRGSAFDGYFSMRYLFSYHNPSDRVRFIMKDGDPQQRNEIIRALMEVFPNAKEGGCGWHIGESPVYMDNIIFNMKHT